MSRFGIVFVALMLAAASPASPAVFPRDAPPGHCRVVHGRLRIYNGTFSYRIWVIGTSRMLRVVNASGDNFMDPVLLPRSVGREVTRLKWDFWDYAVFADFTVCDFTRSRPGVMQSVTLTAARHVRLIKDPPR